jgi:hypothetical protein
MSASVDWRGLTYVGLLGATLAACGPLGATSTPAVSNRVPIFVAQGADATLTSIPSSVVSLTLPDGQYLFEAKFLYLTSSERPVPVSCNFPDGTKVAFVACSESNQVLNPPIAYNSMDGHLLCAGKVSNGPVTISIECNVTEGLGSVTVLRPVLVAIPATYSVRN